jgi:hypothetical protein
MANPLVRRSAAKDVSPTPEKTAAANAAHLARLLKASDYPSVG